MGEGEEEGEGVVAGGSFKHLGESYGRGESCVSDGLLRGKEGQGVVEVSFGWGGRESSDSGKLGVETNLEVLPIDRMIRYGLA